jgi:hypothetical protein
MFDGPLSRQGAAMTKFTKLMPETKTSDIDCGWGMTAQMTYKPRQITYTEDEAKRVSGQNEDTDSTEIRLQLAEELCRVLTAWDMTGPVPIEDLPGHAVGSVIGEDEPVPFEPSILSYLPQPLLAGIVLGLTLDAQPDPKRMQHASRGRGSTPMSTTKNGTQDESPRSLSTLANS